MSFGNSCDEFEFSLPVNAIAQIILYSIKGRVRSNSTSTDEQHNTERESLFLLYISLKIYFVMRSRIIIDIFHAHGLCVSHEKIVRVTIGLSKVTLNLFKHKKEVLGNLRTNLCTIEATNNIDKNSRCTISKSHCHGTSLSYFNFLLL